MKNKERINDILQTIANLLYINQHKIKNVGLLNGKMGIAIFLYHYAHYKKQNAYEELADDFIGEIFDNKMNNVRHPNFSEGISGLIWGINYLNENKFIEMEDNAISEDLEKFLLANISVKMPIINPEVINLFGIGVYYAEKYKDISLCAKDVGIIETIIKECQRIMDEHKSNAIFDISFLNSILYFLIEISKHNNVKKSPIRRLSFLVSDILSKHHDYSSYREKDVYILQKNVKRIQRIDSKKSKWKQVQSKIDCESLSGLSCFDWQNFVYFMYDNMQINDSLLDEIESFVEKEIDKSYPLDFTLSGKLLNIGLGLIKNVR
ncbi:MAG: hypothetical protein LBS52_10100 [Dysgonamonadaceae bacterium]|jgi:hypothetical protein|nr:hypothetical protein [Dysgonamonadaceae bacterium]